MKKRNKEAQTHRRQRPAHIPRAVHVERFLKNSDKFNFNFVQDK
jgi:hypothetical protein